MVAVRQALDELIRAGHPACFHAFLFRGVRISPAQVIEDRAGEEDIFLQDDRDLISE